MNNVCFDNYRTSIYCFVKGLLFNAVMFIESSYYIFRITVNVSLQYLDDGLKANT